MNHSPQMPEPKRLDEGPKKPRGEGWAAKGACLILPGLGQFLERRLIAGTFFLVLALVGLAMFVAPFIDWFATYIQVLQREVERSELWSLPWRHLIGGVVLMLISYVWSFMDAGRQ